MASSFRRPRGTPTVQMHMYVATDVKQKIDEYAAIANSPQWAVVEAAIRAGTPGPNGLPTEWDMVTGEPQMEMNLSEKKRA
ncbi:hypothetical protein [Brachybacterium sp. UNK5269]|uniref:hypothetical protein n=1 Tax=Brachybacterium sp. UNK5269 TaxID=3408576 RepID=UPI003BAE6CB4